MLDEPPDTVKAADGSRIPLAVFGKHRAWSDHLEDIGLDTPSLGKFKQSFYTDGIRTNLDTGAWEPLSEEGKTVDWDHELFMTGPRGMILARLWASTDGRGRRSYPMIAATHLPTTRLPADLTPLQEALELAKEQCSSADTQDAVRSAAVSGKIALEYAVRNLSPMPAEGPTEESRARFLGMGSGEEGFRRILHVMLADLAAFSKNRRQPDVRPRHFRLPSSPGDRGKGFLMWHTFFQPHLPDGTLWTIIAPKDGGWADVSVGGTDSDFVHLSRLNAEGMPPLNEIPYSLAPENEEQFGKILSSFTSPPFAVTSLFAPDQPSGTFSSVMGRLFGKGQP
ncbi:hypothetical protein OVA24_11465 [Luteolibacter sp. SL250]|uniref:hypothetical protein n=1 Tax=Luteolibacter sp. SL250 TaxID=2995170 RepID=UPI00226E0F7D|nr:hypothetical protein [Luteolibacter sp. SL250]WAC17862.1 hypothetical protein OVA24_11465 [Luteolibacter sp. SL250]